MQSRILVAGPFEPDDIVVEFNDISNIKTESWIHSLIEEAWENLQIQAKQKNQVLWNGQSLRLNSFILQNGKLILEVSSIRFKERICLERSADKLESLDSSYFSQGIAVGGLIKTIDNYFIFGKRSGKTVAQSSIDLIGGVLDSLDAKNGSDLFEFNLKEIKEEINLTSENILNSYFLGLIQGNKGNAILATSINLNINSNQVKCSFKSNHDEEMGSVILIQESKLLEYLNKLGGYKPILAELYEKVINR